jgi:hypothetical protein
MEAVQTAEPLGLHTPTFESVWGTLDRLAESQKNTDRIVKEVGKRLGDFTNNFGDVVEYMIAPNLQEKFLDLGYDFQEASTKHKVRDKKMIFLLRLMFSCKMAILPCWLK